MSPSDRFRRWIRLPARRATIRADVDAEIAHHLDATERELVARGMSPEDARREARSRFGDIDDVRETLGNLDRHGERRRSLGDFWRGWGQDLARSVHSLRREPGFAAVVAVTLALGLGGNATMFRVLDRVLLRPAPHVRDDGSLSLLYFQRESPEFGRVTSTSQSYPVFAEMRRRLGAGTELAAWWTSPATSGHGADARSIEVNYVTPNFFDVLGVGPWQGRVFGNGDWKAEGEPGVVLTNSFAMSRFGSGAAAIGKTLEIDGGTFTVIGIAPPGFVGPILRHVDLFATMQSGVERIGANWETNRDMRWLQMVVRRAPGVAPEQLGAVATAAARDIARALVKSDTAATVIAGSIIPAKRPNGNRSVQVTVWLSGVTLLVLLVACANVANLMLARTIRRRRELAVHLALGVSRARVTRMLLTESVILGILAAGLAIVFATWGDGILRSTLLQDMPWEGGAIDTRTAGFVALLALVAATLAGAVPAFVAAHTPLLESLKTGARDGGGRRGLLRSALVVVQGTLSVMLLVGAGLFVRSFQRASSLDLGFSPANVFVASPELGSIARTPEELEGRWRALEQDVRALPGVVSVAQSITVPFESQWTKPIVANGDTVAPMKGGGPYANGVSPDYFATMATSIRRGRAFTAADRKGSPPVVLVNEQMAAHLWPGRDALGQCVEMEETRGCVTVVGIVADQRIEQLAGDAPAHYYQPIGQWSAEWRALLVRVAEDGGANANDIRRAIIARESALPFVPVRELSSIIDEQLQPWRLGATLFALFGALGLVVAALGLYSVIAHDVAQRGHEIGVRLALGARRTDVARLVVRRGIRQALAGVAAGLVLAAVVSRRFAELLFRTSPGDPAVYGGVALILLVVALAATLLPARRASRVEPVEALRGE
ncbi:MAG: ABC transporter permease [Gemmatimonadaceae bacterium]|nr:ABC transporter permease [Gemmatimonadaceae bacterium]